MFKSHLLTMILFAAIVSTIMGFLRFETPRQILGYALKLFGYMVGGVIIFSWIMHFL